MNNITTKKIDKNKAISPDSRLCNAVSYHRVATFICLALAFTFGSPTVQANTASPSNEALYAEIDLEYFAKMCSFLQTDRVALKQRSANLSATRMIRLLKKVVAKKLPGSSSMRDEEIYHGVQLENGQRPTTFEGFGRHPMTSYSGYLVRNHQCSTLKSEYLEKYDVYGVEAQNRDGISVIGHLFQRKFADATYLFIVISKPFHTQGAAQAPFDSIDELDLIKTFMAVTDQQIVQTIRAAADSHSNPGRKLNLRIKQIHEARQALIRSNSTYGDLVYDGDYFESADTASWKAQSYLNPIHSESDSSNKTIDVVYFDEYDDGSYSFYFVEGTSDLIQIVYEN